MEDARSGGGDETSRNKSTKPGTTHFNTKARQRLCARPSVPGIPFGDSMRMVATLLEVCQFCWSENLNKCDRRVPMPLRVTHPKALNILRTGR